jgi:alpha-galactosidase
VSLAEKDFQQLIEGVKDLPTQRTHEYSSYILEAVETNNPARINGNVPNRGLITNLPEGCCVEVPCLVDANGVQGVFVGNVPTQLAALNRTNINVQELMMDPLTAAVCTLPQIHAMVDEMLEAQAQWLPQSKG